MNKMTKIQCVKDFDCEICHRRGMLQILGNYGRVRHYRGFDSTSKKPMFEYHRQSLEHIQGTIERNHNLDLIGQGNIDLKLNNSASVSQKEVGRSSSLVRTLALRAKGRRFKSGSAHPRELLLEFHCCSTD